MVYDYFFTSKNSLKKAWLAQSVERTTLNRVVVGSIPTLGVNFSKQKFLLALPQAQYCCRAYLVAASVFAPIILLGCSLIRPKFVVAWENLAACNDCFAVVPG